MSEISQLFTAYLGYARQASNYLDKADADVARKQAEAAATAESLATNYREQEAAIQRQRAELLARYNKTADRLARYGADPRRLDRQEHPSLPASFAEGMAQLAAAEAEVAAAIDAAWKANLSPN
ncbi:MAG: hypothetical protein LBO75_05515 [Bifidobacteriaceae bacterium]|jgi:hypothetical protein|nr:hypothetical protein [Bifidobacteriaceae bacterium]